MAIKMYNRNRNVLPMTYQKMIKRRIDKVEENSKNTWCKYKTYKFHRTIRWTKPKYLKYLKIQNAWKEKHFATFGIRKYIFPNIIWPRFMLLTFFISRNALNDEIKQEFVSPSGLEIILHLRLQKYISNQVHQKPYILCLFVSRLRNRNLKYDCWMSTGFWSEIFGSVSDSVWAKPMKSIIFAF